MEKRVKIGLVEEPAIKLLDPRGNNWMIMRYGDPLLSEQILAGALLAAGYQTKLFNLKKGTAEKIFGETKWRGMKISKIAAGTPWDGLDAKECDVWVLTVNLLHKREVSLKIIRHLSSRGGRVVARGSDVFSEPQAYINAGAMIAVADRSGRSDIAAVEAALGKTPEEPYRLYAANGRLFSPQFSRLHPEDWPLPPVEFVRETLGTRLFWKADGADNFLPSGAVFWDHGCDRHCDFCDIPTFKLGYQYMLPERALEWLALQKSAGAKSVVCRSEQFLGRILYKEGRREILDIMKGLREMGMSIVWRNGLELAKASVGRGFKNGDPTPDEEMIEALWGFKDNSGCLMSFLPGERPLQGPEAYPKLLSWRHHIEMLKAIARAGVPGISYGTIIGLPDDTPEKIEQMYRAISRIREEMLAVNPNLFFRARAQALVPIPGTPASDNLKRQGLIRFTDTTIVGNPLTPTVDTKFMSYEEVSDWQLKMVSDFENDRWQEFSGHLKT